MTRSRPDPGPIPVVHLIDTLYLYGTERQMIEQLRRLDRSRWRPLVGSLHQEGPLLGDLDALAIPHRPFPVHTSLAHPNTLIQAVRLGLWCRRHSARILHAHDYGSNVVAVVAARIAGVRLIVSRRDLCNWLAPRQERLLGHACRLADAIIANAEAVARHTRQRFGVDAARITTIPNGIDLQRFDRAAHLAPDPPLDLPSHPGAPPVLAMVANMHRPDKGHGDLLAALAQLRQRGRRVDALFIGVGAEAGRIAHTAATLGLAAQVRFLGQRSDVPRILARVDLACLPSWAEGMPNAVMEAMAAARPVVATCVGGCPELIAHGQSGLLVPPRSPGALADAIEQLLRDPQSARRMGERARSAIAERYTIAQSVDRLERLYSALIGPSVPTWRAEEMRP